MDRVDDWPGAGIPPLGLGLLKLPLAPRLDVLLRQLKVINYGLRPLFAVSLRQRQEAEVL